MTDLRAAAQQALEALETSGCSAFKGLACRCSRECASYIAAKALRAALAQKQAGSWHDGVLEGQLRERERWLAQEQAEPARGPLVWINAELDVLTSHPACWGREDEAWTALSPAPPQRPPLTDEEIKAVLISVDPETKRLPPGLREFARAIEKKVRGE